MDELSAWLTLVRAPGVHAGQLSALLQHFPRVESLVTASATSLRAAGANAALIDWLGEQRGEHLAGDLRWLEHEQHHFVPWGSPLYPPLLAELADAPIGLFVRGDPSALSLPQLAIVGSRNPTAVGRENAREFASHLARCGLVITSGFALGIDAASHEGALEAGGKTIAVCGTGLDMEDPRGNSEAAERIGGSGALGRAS